MCYFILNFAGWANHFKNKKVYLFKLHFCLYFTVASHFYTTSSHLTNEKSLGYWILRNVIVIKISAVTYFTQSELACQLHELQPQTRPHYTSLACTQNNKPTYLPAPSLNNDSYRLRVEPFFLHWSKPTSINYQAILRRITYVKESCVKVVLGKVRREAAGWSPASVDWQLSRLAAGWDNHAQLRGAATRISPVFP